MLWSTWVSFSHPGIRQTYTCNIAPKEADFQLKKKTTTKNTLLPAVVILKKIIFLGWEFQDYSLLQTYEKVRMVGTKLKSTLQNTTEIYLSISIYLYINEDFKNNPTCSLTPCALACAVCARVSVRVHTGHRPLGPHPSLPQAHVSKFKVLVFFKDDFTSVIFCEHIWCFFKAWIYWMSYLMKEEFMLFQHKFILFFPGSSSSAQSWWLLKMVGQNPIKNIKATE